jgi:hypothetical protein
MVLLAGCAGMPESGSVHFGRAIPAAPGLGEDVADVRVLPRSPQPGMNPRDIVHGFLRAMVSRDGGYETARQYLTARAAATWKPDLGVTTYDEGGVRLLPHVDGSDLSIRFRAPRIGSISNRGDFAPRGGTVAAAFGMTKVAGEWRIERLPDGALLSSSDATRSYRFADVYYPNRLGAPALAPEQVLLPPDPGGITTALVRALVAGPGGWLAPAVRTGFPAGTELLGSVPVDRSGVAEVNLSVAARQASDTDLRTMSAQLSWTLRQVQEISSVRLLADGAQLAVFATKGAPDEFVDFDPAPRSSLTAFFRTGDDWALVGADTAPALAPVHGLNAVALSRGGDRLAGLGPTRFGMTLHVGPAGAPPPVQLRGRHLTAPTFGPNGEVYTVVTDHTGQWVARVPEGGAVRRVPAAAAITRRPVQALRISPDGARVAAVVGPPDRGRLLVGRVAVRNGDPTFGGFRAVLPGVVDIRGLSWGWTVPGQVVVSAAVAEGQRELLAVDANGYSTVTISTAGLTAQPTEVATSPGHPLVIAAGGDIWVDQPTGGWRREGPGAEPRYAG